MVTATPAADRRLPGELLPGDAGDAEHAASPPGDGRAPARTDELAARQRPRIEQVAAALAALLPHLSELTVAVPAADLAWSHARFGHPPRWSAAQ